MNICSLWEVVFHLKSNLLILKSKHANNPVPVYIICSETHSVSTVACGQSKEITAFKGYQLLRVQGLWYKYCTQFTTSNTLGVNNCVLILFVSTISWKACPLKQKSTQSTASQFLASLLPANIKGVIFLLCE